MRRPHGVFAGLLSLAALCATGCAAEAATQGSTAAQGSAAQQGSAPSPGSAAAQGSAVSSETSCRVSVAKPRLSAKGKITSFATRRGCDSPALLRIRIQRAVPGPDRVVKSGATRNGRVTLVLACKPGTYYAFATDYRGRTVKSRAVRLACAPVSTPTPTPSPSGTPTSPAPSTGGVGTALENEVLRLTNAERAKGGCAPLKLDPLLRAAAFGHSSDMAKQGYFDHASKDGRDFMDRIRAAGFSGGRAFAENIAFGQPTPASVVEGWMNSPGHRANIMNCAYNLIGVGAAKNAQGRIYWTQDFVGR
ncbi:CAP domain-containing protein [Nonomuraea sp. CA-141351]|uniref:CAP domain-containing protein n=1 Tax=Nonomuraea sp. CA-141351 TaxID=3239996 RepID=UPI003D8AB36B